MTTDPITDMLNRIKNAHAVGHKTVEIPYSKIAFEIGRLLCREGFLQAIDRYGRVPRKTIKITLLASNTDNVITGMRRLSKPGQRLYASYLAIPRVRFGKGIVIVSTSKGLMTDREARKKKIGGELLAEVW